MTASVTADKPKRRTAADRLALAAAPTFALAALLAATGGAPMPFCAPAAGLLPVDGMTAMYLLMAVFHLPPWLRLAARTGA